MSQDQHHNDNVFTSNRTEHKEQRRNLRTNGTTAEGRMWLMLKARQVEGVRFRRQFSIGPYILDFYSPELRLCIELDGDPHFSQTGYEHDLVRTEYLTRFHGIRTLRFENKDIFQYPEAVLSEIRSAIEEIRKKENTKHEESM